MRTGTILAWLAVIVLFAAFGLKVFGWILLFALAAVVLGVGAVLVAFWAIQRRMRRNLEQITRAMAGERGGPGDASRPDRAGGGRGGSGDVIDVEPVRRPRDGADAPEE
jgi:O-antigen ligase